MPRARSFATTRCTRSNTAATKPPQVADLISTAVLRRHLETMHRLDIEYDFLPRESEILHLHFWDAAFEQLKETGVLYFETEGKNKGCWVMRGGPRLHETRRDGEDPTKTPRSSSAPTAPSPTSAKTSPITCGSSACWAATSATASSSRTQRPRVLDFDRARREPTIRTSAARSAIYNVIDVAPDRSAGTT